VIQRLKNRNRIDVLQSWDAEKKRFSEKISVAQKAIFVFDVDVASLSLL
jgi:hypothetical protein